MKTRTIWAGPGWYAASQEGSPEDACVVSRWVGWPEDGRREAEAVARRMGLGTPVLVSEGKALSAPAVTEN